MIKLSKLFLYLFVLNCCSNDINKLDEKGYAEIHYAVKTGDCQLVEELISKGANINLPANDMRKSHPLYFAIIGKNINIVKLLVAKNAEINYQDTDGSTPLMLASWSGQDKIVEYLLEKKADINIVNHFGHSAVFTNSLKTLNILLKNGANIDIVDVKGISPKENFNRYFGDTVLWEVLTSKNMKETLNLRNLNQETPLHLAIRNEAFWLAEMLIDKGADVNARNKDGETPLHYAVFHMHDLDIVKKLVEKGADVNARSEGGYSPIFSARFDEENVPIIEYLIKHGALVNLRNDNGLTVLDKNIEVLKIKEVLIKAGAKKGNEIK